MVLLLAQDHKQQLIDRYSWSEVIKIHLNCNNYLDADVNSIHFAGKVRAGAAIKLKVNALSQIQVAAFVECSILWVTLNLLSRKVVRSKRLHQHVFTAKAMLAGNLNPMFPIELVKTFFNLIIYSAKSKNRGSNFRECRFYIF